jgi:hypothetical protein
MVGLSAVQTSPRARAVALGSLGVLMAGILAAGGAAAQGAPHRADAAAAKVPPGIAQATLSAVTAVPHSTDVWAIGGTGSGVDNEHFFTAHRHGGRWKRIKAPKLRGRYGVLDTFAAASPKAVWLGGGIQVAGIQNLPSIWRWNGKSFAAAKLPKLANGAVDITSISASSATNAWAVGGIYPLGSGGQAALHWNGKKWSAVAFPEGLDFEGLSVVSTSGPDNAWAVRTDGALVHWDGKTWSVDGAAPAGAQLTGVATSSPKLAYAVGSKPLPSGHQQTVIMRFNGKTWSTVKVAKSIDLVGLREVTMHGKSAWALGVHFTSRSSVPVILHTSGGAWHAQNSPGGRSYEMTSISAASATRAYAAGFYYDFATAQGRSFFDVFNGHRWNGTPSKV